MDLGAEKADVTGAGFSTRIQKETNVAQTFTRLVNKLLQVLLHRRDSAAPHNFAKGEFAGRRRLSDR